MRYKPIVVLFMVAVLLICVSSAAHSGRTDSNGGHRDSSTGEYHYHHGYPAHQHENGVCPYDYDDRTGWNSGSSSSSESSSETQSYIPSANEVHLNTPAPQAEEDDQKGSGRAVWKSVALYAAGGTAGISTICAVATGKAAGNARREINEKDATMAQLQKKLNDKSDELQSVKLDLTQEHEKYERQRDSVDELLSFIIENGGINLDDVIPEGSSVGSDGLPCDAQTSLILPWGEHYTFFTTRYGKAFHAYGCKCITYNSRIPMNALSVKSMAQCQMCMPVLPDLSWYGKYLKLKKMKAKYDI